MKTPLFQHKMLTWFKRHKRNLPWRKTKDPYKIWVSEIMLQQTQIVTVIPYYQKWMKRFPTLASLAKTPLSEVLKYWAGLGYYRRVRMLHQGARIIARRLGGQFPHTLQALTQLPGIGRYTAGAIASIAFGQKAPLLDGNVMRVITRVFKISKPIDQPKTLKALWKIAEGLVPRENPGDFNEAMMELGATVCFPQNPRCKLCPLKGLCAAHKIGKETAFPKKKKRQVLQKKQMAALVLHRQNQVLLQKQPYHHRWGGLWTFLFGENKTVLAKKLTLQISDLCPLLTLRHGFTKYQITLKVYQTGSIGRIVPKTIKKRTLRWVKIRNLHEMPLPYPHQKIASHLLEEK